MYHLIGEIELCRGRRKNLRMPKWLAGDYEKALNEIVVMGSRDIPKAEDPFTVRTILGAIAMATHHHWVGSCILEHSDDDLAAMIETYNS
jgi:hypothetical protein